MGQGFIDFLVLCLLCQRRQRLAARQLETGVAPLVLRVLLGPGTTIPTSVSSASGTSSATSVPVESNRNLHGAVETWCGGTDGGVDSRSGSDTGSAGARARWHRQEKLQVQP